MMDAEFEIRPYQGRADKRELQLIELPRKYIRQYTNAPPFYYALMMLGISRDYLYLLIQNGSERIAGTVLLRRRLSITGRTYHWKMHAVFVAPDLRGKGLAVKLVYYALARLREHGAEEVSLKVDEGNEAAISLYRKCGFIERMRTNKQHILVKQLTGTAQPEE